MNVDKTKMLIGGIYIVRILILRTLLDIERISETYNEHSWK